MLPILRILLGKLKYLIYYEQINNNTNYAHVSTFYHTLNILVYLIYDFTDIFLFKKKIFMIMNNLIEIIVVTGCVHICIKYAIYFSIN